MGEGRLCRSLEDGAERLLFSGRGIAATGRFAIGRPAGYRTPLSGYRISAIGYRRKVKGERIKKITRSGASLFFLLVELVELVELVRLAD